MSVIKVDVPNKLASRRYEARIKANNYTIISQQFNDISHSWRQNIGSHHLPRYTRYRVIAGRVIKGGDCTWNADSRSLASRGVIPSTIGPFYNNNADYNNIPQLRQVMDCAVKVRRKIKTREVTIGGMTKT